jgi:hypothetical protein
VGGESNSGSTDLVVESVTDVMGASERCADEEGMFSCRESEVGLVAFCCPVVLRDEVVEWSRGYLDRKGLRDGMEKDSAADKGGACAESGVREKS